MADRGDTHYSVSSLNKWFFVSSLALLVAVVWTMLDDWNRGWKKYQREFRAIETERARAEEAALVEEGAATRESDLQKQVAAAQQAVDAHKGDIAVLEEKQRQARGVLWSAVEAAKKAKSQFNWDRFVVEEERIKRGDPGFEAEKMEASERHMNDLIGQQQVAESALSSVQAELKDKRAALDGANSALSAGTRDLDRVRKRLDQLAPTETATRIADVIRDAPGLDFIGPNLMVKKAVLADLTFELNFTKKKRIDMCMTCHLGIDRAGFDGEAQPFSSHPRLDLYLSSKSPHPMNRFGCTICHRGSGEALDFVRADHRPETMAQEHQWEEEFGWHKQHHWDYPMLQKSRTEASCVQCHKTSMELISADAPVVSKGYRLVERYGCYACHKIDWFPTKRRPGPVLKNLQAKFSPEFLSAWISNPKDFRPTTWMPQFFHLENYAADATVVASKYGTEREIKGGEWDDAAVDAVAAFLLAKAPKVELPEVPVQGDPTRGAEVMRLSGCYGCHNVAPWGGEEPKVNDLAQAQNETNQHGPNLRGVATKVDPTWLYWWIKDPTTYWPETRMPNLRLSDQDAADVAAYILEDPDGVFHDVPQSWKPATVQMDPEQEHEVLAEQARWYFARLGRSAVEERLAGQDPQNRWDDLQTLKVAVGEKIIGNYGCYSCHEIAGMENVMPIGTELSNWGSKTVDKLDFGFGTSLFGLNPEYREPWLVQKLHAPRSFDQQKVKNPTEKLRMPWFNFTDEEVEAISTFVVGLVDDEVQHAKMVPDTGDLAMDAGMRAVRQKNCVACHMIDPGRIRFQDDEGRTHDVAAELLGVGDEPVPPAHDLASLNKELDRMEADEVGFRMLANEPEIGARVGDKLFVARDKVLGLTAPHGGDLIRLVTDYYFHGQELFDSKAENEDDAYYSVTADPDGEQKIQDVDGTFRDHSSEPYDKIRWTFAPPVLWDEGGKVKKDWFYAFLRDVVPIRHQVRVRMPSFHFEAGEAESIAGYFAFKSAREWPARYARDLQLDSGLSPAELAKKGKGLSAEMLTAIQGGSAPDIAANFSKVLDLGHSLDYLHEPAVDPDFEASLLRSRAYLDQRAASEPDHLRVGERIAVEAVNCYQCHFRLDQAPAGEPIAWAPDLASVAPRLRESWVKRWLEDPGRIYPGTAMPANFTSDPPQYQAEYPDSTNSRQVLAVLEWLYNFDRVYLGGFSE